MPFPDEIITVRVPALPEQIGLSLQDRLIVWVASQNKTKQVTSAQLRTFLLEGFSGSQPPVYVNGSYVVQVGSAEAGTQTFPIPSLQGKTFNLRRQGLGIMPITTWEILDAGGFRLTTFGDTLVLGETFELDITEYRTTPGASGGGFSLGGVRPVSASTTLVAADVNKLIQIRSGTTPIMLTLPELSTVAENSIWPVEMMVNNSYPCRIQTQAAQNIYFRNTAQAALYINVGEAISFLAGSDGWYVVNQDGNFLTVGELVPGYKAGFNQLPLDGSLLERDKHPRLWRFAETLGASIVSDSVWNTASLPLTNPTRTILKPYRGCFSTGNGSTTFRLPDWRGVSLRGLKAGTDTERTHNIAGNYQDHMFQGHAHAEFVDNGNTYTGEVLTPNNGPARRQGNGAGAGNVNYEYNITGSSGTPTLGATSVVGGTETRMENIGINWYIKS